MTPNPRTGRRIATVLSAGALATGALLASVATPATAGTAPSITHLSCYSPWVPDFTCSASWTGGTGPFTVNWSVSNIQSHIYPDQQDSTSATAEGVCTAAGSGNTVTFTVTDSTGAQAVATTFFKCSTYYA